MRIHVTQEHIDRGEKNSICSCPVGLALQDAFPGEHVALGNLFRIWKRPMTQVLIIVGDTERPMPWSVRRFATRFDNDKPVKPFSFNFKPEVG